VPSTFTILSVQAKPFAWDPEATLGRLEHEVLAYRRTFPHVDLYLYPELFLAAEDPWTGSAPPGYEARVAESIPGPRTERLGALARRVRRWICAGSVLERAGRSVFNTALVFDPRGDLVVRYRKVFPWMPFETTARGTEPPPVFNVPRVGIFGIYICYDGWFPEMTRSLALRGAEVILHPTLTTTADREQEVALARANAITNQCYVLNVNSVPSIGGGRSIGVDPNGRILFELGHEEGFAIETVDLELARTVRREGTVGLNRVLEHLRDAPKSVFEPYRELLRRKRS
jgi:formamidase